VHPASESAGACVANLKRKLTAGAKAAITQFFFDNRDYFDFMERVRAAGVYQPIIPGILLIHDFNKVASFASRCKARVPEAYHDMFERLPAHSAEHKEQACELAADQIVRLAAQGVDHVHIYTMNRPDLVERTCRLAGIETVHQLRNRWPEACILKDAPNEPHRTSNPRPKTAIIGFDEPFCVIGERINPTGRKKLAAELEAGDFSTVEKDALEQVACGATVLDVNAGVVYNSNPEPERDRTAADAEDDRVGAGAGRCPALHRQLGARRAGGGAGGLRRAARW
jgi:hypothetical protein